jgi:hypothetical protein
MKYVVSSWGNGISVALIGPPEEVRSDANLAHNLFNASFKSDFMNGRINFPGIRTFYRFLIYKHALPYMDECACSLRPAMVGTKAELKAHKIEKRNFMREYQSSRSVYQIGSHNDGDFGYYYED